MAQIGRGGGSRRPQYGSRAYLSRVTRHGTVTSRWPRARGSAKDPWTKHWIDWFTDVVAAVKRTNERERSPIRNAILAVNRANRGLRGSAAIRLDDWDHARLSGRQFALQLPNGRIAYPRAAHYDAARRLEWFEPMVGSILVRTEETWLPAIACEVGARLMSVPDGAVPGCCPPARLATQSEGPPDARIPPTNG